MHDHHPHAYHHKDEHEDREPSQSEENCAACVFINTHVNFEIQPTVIASSTLYYGTLLVGEAILIPSKLTANNKSRAPPIFSI